MENEKSSLQAAGDESRFPAPGAPDPLEAAPSGRLQALLENVERDQIVAALQAARGNKAKAARALEITERMIGIRVSKYGIDWRQFRRR